MTTTIPTTDELLVVECDRCDRILGDSRQWTYTDVDEAWQAALAARWLPLPVEDGLVCPTCQARAQAKVDDDPCPSHQHVLTAWEESGGIWHRTCTACGATQVQAAHILDDGRA